jgi:hypothetical protein
VDGAGDEEEREETHKERRCVGGRRNERKERKERKERGVAAARCLLVVRRWVPCCWGRCGALASPKKVTSAATGEKSNVNDAKAYQALGFRQGQPSKP